VSAVDTDRLAALEEERDFLLRSLEDLEREHDAGDVDELDYHALKDDYTARAAAVLRRIHAGGSRPAARPGRGRSWGRLAGIAAAVLAFAVLAGVLVAQTAGRRDAGEVATGGISQSVTEKLNEAGRLGGQGDMAAAIEVYDEVLEDDPTNPEALTYKGWMLTLSGDTSGGLEVLIDAATNHPDYPDVHAFLAIVFFRNGLVAQADRELDRLDALDPPETIRDLTASLRAQIDAALASTTTAAP
jgi:tetratricopeptide (TPR) repeat protein